MTTPVPPRWVRHRFLGSVLASVLALWVVTGCASLPQSSHPQALRTIDQEPTAEGPPPPIPGRDADLLLRDFLRASAEPAERHAAARQYLTPNANATWDDATSTIIVEEADTLRESRTDERATYVIRARKVGDLGADGAYHGIEGPPLEYKIDMRRVGSEWRIDELPNGVVMESAAFTKAYRRQVLYFLDSDAQHVVPDLRWIPASQDRRVQRLVSLLIDGPQPNIRPVVLNALAKPIGVREPITKADGDGSGIGVGQGGVKIDFSGAANLNPQQRQNLAAQVVLTLASADILGPYLLSADGKPLDDRFVGGWRVQDVGPLAATVRPADQTGLHALRQGSLVDVADGKTTPAPGFFGAVHSLMSAGLSADGQLVAAVAATGRPAPQASQVLMMGTYGGEPFPVAEGDTISRPSWTGDGSAAWAVVNGNRVIRAVNDRQTGAVSVHDVDISGLNVADNSGKPLRMPITELRIGRSGVRAALIADGQVYLAVVQRRQDGSFALLNPQPLALGLSTRAQSLSWLTDDAIILTREGNVDPVISVSIDGSQQVPQTQQNLTPPVRVVAAAPDTQYVADSRAVLQLHFPDPSSNDQFWREVPGLTGENTLPVLPG